MAQLAPQYDPAYPTLKPVKVGNYRLFDDPELFKDKRTLWIGSLERERDFRYLLGCFAYTGKVKKAMVNLNHTGLVEFKSCRDAGDVLRKYNGTSMPDSSRRFEIRFAWAIKKAVPGGKDVNGEVLQAKSCGKRIKFVDNNDDEPGSKRSPRRKRRRQAKFCGQHIKFVDNSDGESKFCGQHINFIYNSDDEDELGSG